ncbi:MAG: AAA family ATPase [Lachnospiraceae bacterium]|nr:AAA family ATPase [Lachnospiraceae bacterium]
MGIFLNTAVPYEAYKRITSTRFFVDKTRLLCELLEGIKADGQRYVCVTRPRRFGKTVMAVMIASFLEKSVESGDIFDKLAVSKKHLCREYQNKYDVFYMDLSRVPENCSSYEQYILRVLNGMKEDLSGEFSDLKLDTGKAVWDILAEIFRRTGKKFVFVLDEWDAVFHMPFVTVAEQVKYLDFLKNLLKDQEYVELAYMTGILPIAKYSDGSELNMFDEYDMAVKEKYGQYFGFSEEEVDTLFDTYLRTTEHPRITRNALRNWYDGYHTASGSSLYNPRSVVCALRDNQLANYWTSSGAYDSIFHYIQGNIEEVREDLVLMVSGERVEAKMMEYAATAKELNTKDQIYSAMVVYGLLTYEDGQVFIPNKELMDKFHELFMSNERLGYVYHLAKESAKMLKATLSGDTKTMAEILKFVHDTESPILSYNHEIELAAIVNLVYLAARDKYRVEREDKAGEGYVDFVFYPERREADALILELKIDGSPDEAIRQIKDKNYALCLKGKLGETPKYTGRILAVGISYDRKTKEHFCKVEQIK